MLARLAAAPAARVVYEVAHGGKLAEAGIPPLLTQLGYTKWDFGHSIHLEHNMVFSKANLSLRSREVVANVSKWADAGCGGTCRPKRMAGRRFTRGSKDRAGVSPTSRGAADGATARASAPTTRGGGGALLAGARRPRAEAAAGLAARAAGGQNHKPRGSRRGF